MRGIRNGVRGLANTKALVFVFVTGFCVFGFSNQSAATVLATASTQTLGYGPDNPAAACFQLGIVSGFDAAFPIFENLALTPADIGNTFVVNASNDADFNALVAVLTNGMSDFLKEELGSFGGFPVFGMYFTESGLFGNIAGSPAVDFHGYSINSISLTVNQLSLAGNVTFEGTLTVEGTAVPEPNTMMLTCVGLVAIASAYALRRKQIG